MTRRLAPSSLSNPAGLANLGPQRQEQQQQPPARTCDRIAAEPSLDARARSRERTRARAAAASLSPPSSSSSRTRAVTRCDACPVRTGSCGHVKMGLLRTSLLLAAALARRVRVWSYWSLVYGCCALCACAALLKLCWNVVLRPAATFRWAPRATAPPCLGDTSLGTHCYVRIKVRPPRAHAHAHAHTHTHTQAGRRERGRPRLFVVVVVAARRDVITRA